jgi:hypothetical protein
MSHKGQGGGHSGLPLRSADTLVRFSSPGSLPTRPSLFPFLTFSLLANRNWAREAEVEALATCLTLTPSQGRPILSLPVPEARPAPGGCQLPFFTEGNSVDPTGLQRPVPSTLHPGCGASGGAHSGAERAGNPASWRRARRPGRISGLRPAAGGLEGSGKEGPGSSGATLGPKGRSGYSPPTRPGCLGPFGPDPGPAAVSSAPAPLLPPRSRAHASPRPPGPLQSVARSSARPYSSPQLQLLGARRWFRSHKMAALTAATSAPAAPGQAGKGGGHTGAPPTVHYAHAH